MPRHPIPRGCNHVQHQPIFENFVKCQKCGRTGWKDEFGTVYWHRADHIKINREMRQREAQWKAVVST